ncbi:MAG: HNH endonuclease signature motif containing protein [Microthrixaceae bacterium]
MKRTGLRRNTPLRASTPLRRSMPLRPQSTRARRVAQQRAHLRVTLREQRGATCEYPGCREPWVDMHERKKRSRGGSVLDPANIALLCRPHHEWTETNPAEATLMGFLTPSWED